MYLPRFRKKCCFQKHLAFQKPSKSKRRTCSRCMAFWFGRLQSSSVPPSRDLQLFHQESFLVGKWNHKESSLSMQMISNDHPSHKGLQFLWCFFGRSRNITNCLKPFWHTGQTRTREIYDQAIENLPQDGWCFMIVVERTQPCWLRVQADCIWFDTTRASSFSETYMSTWILPE